MTGAPLAWVQEIQSTLINTKAIPLSGFIPPFPWDLFSQAISDMLQVPTFKLKRRQTRFLKEDAIVSGFGVGYIAIALEITPIPGQIFWIMNKEDVAQLTALALTNPGNKGFSSPEFQEGFYYYLATHALNKLNELTPFEDLSIQLGKLTAMPQEESLCIDVEITGPKQTIWGRLVCPAAVHNSLKSHFSQNQSAFLNGPLAKEIDVPISVQLGQTSLSIDAFKNARVGDCILLDRCTFDPKTHKGAVTLVFENIPILRARIKDNHLKIVDYATYREEKNSMDFESPDEEREIEEGEEAQPIENEELEQMISSKEIPITLHVEVARLKINLDKLLQLSPGNVLELPVRPEQGVDLIIGGKKVAKAELIKIGDVLGVKILQMGE